MLPEASCKALAVALRAASPVWGQPSGSSGDSGVESAAEAAGATDATLACVSWLNLCNTQSMLATTTNAPPYVCGTHQKRPQIRLPGAHSWPPAWGPRCACRSRLCLAALLRPFCCDSGPASSLGPASAAAPAPELDAAPVSVSQPLPDTGSVPAAVPGAATTASASPALPSVVMPNRSSCPELNALSALPLSVSPASSGRPTWPKLELAAACTPTHPFVLPSPCCCCCCSAFFADRGTATCAKVDQIRTKLICHDIVFP